MVGLLLSSVWRLVGWLERYTLGLCLPSNGRFRPLKFQTDYASGGIFLCKLFELLHFCPCPRFTCSLRRLRHHFLPELHKYSLTNCPKSPDARQPLGSTARALERSA